MDHTTNIQPSSENVKLPKTAGPWRNQRQAADAAKTDPLCIKHKYFHVVLSYGGYTYVTGQTPPLFPSDRVVATYDLMFRGVWSYPTIVTQQQSEKLTRA